ncbi:MAG: ATP-dependent helicase C-terminal domain-containing protein, partial [Desulfococcaceae bacterium]
SADLAPLVLEMAVWGASESDGLDWLDPPPEAAFQSARNLLLQLGAIDPAGMVTAHGREMAGLGVHPRLAHMLLKGREMGRLKLACELAGILSERDILHFSPGAKDADIRLRVDALRKRRSFRTSDAAVNQGACRRIRIQSEHWMKMLTGDAGKDAADAGNDPDRDIGVLLATAYPDRVGQRRSTGDLRYLLSGGRGARFFDYEPLASEEFLVAAELDGAGPDARIYLAAPVRLEDLAAHLPERFSESEVIRWDPQSESVEARLEERFGGLVLHRRPIEKPNPHEVAKAMLDGIRRMGLAALPWNRRLENWRARVMFLRREKGGGLDWPDLSDERLLESLDVWLLPFLGGITRKAQLQRLDLKGGLTAMLSWDQQKALDALAPTHLVVPSGSRIPIDYTAGDVPVLAVRLQEMFGSAETPCISGGGIPLMLHLLSPAGRPLQITRDLGGFWTGSYEQVKKEMKGRYPKHYWPEDPLEAIPTNRAKPRRTK